MEDGEMSGAKNYTMVGSFYREISDKEWNDYEWIEISTFDDVTKGRRVYIRGLKNNLPNSNTDTLDITEAHE